MQYEQKITIDGVSFSLCVQLSEAACERHLEALSAEELISQLQDRHVELLAGMQQSLRLAIQQFFLEVARGQLLALEPCEKVRKTA